MAIILGGLLLTTLAGGIVALVVVGPAALAPGAPVASRPAEPVAVATQPLPTSPSLLSTSVPAGRLPALARAPATPAPASTAAAAAAPATQSLSVPPTQTPTIGTASAGTPIPTPQPTADQAWAFTQDEVSASWGTDTPRTVAILDEFLLRFPDFLPARDKDYAALIAYGNQLAVAGDRQAALDAFRRARDLFPERPEAVLAADLPTPTLLSTPIPLTLTSTLTVRLPSIPTTVPAVPAGATQVP